MLGYPGAGKTTTAKIIEELTGAVRLASDEYRIRLFPQPSFSQAEHDQLYQELDTETERLLQAGTSVVYDANLNRLKHRQDKYAICRRVQARSVLLWVKTPKPVAKDRALHESRSHLWPPSETAEDMFERISSVIEQPGPDEPYIAVDGTKVTRHYIQELLQHHGAATP